ncbi:hypothetical protein [Streptomyces sp. NPDC002205]|uniref:hypothetical protein n=1 Tax=Streptomyces sp. NPDC002205 TaxID=3154411 RepID=UPI0033237DD7
MRDKSPEVSLQPHFSTQARVVAQALVLKIGTDVLTSLARDHGQAIRLTWRTHLPVPPVGVQRQSAAGRSGST